MIECIFTLDYEICGNGEGSLRELVYKPSQRLLKIFNKFNQHLVVFVEALELEKIQEHQSDEAIDDIREQIEKFYQHGFEIGLHIHPQWHNARRKNGRWLLDYSEYNLCRLPREQIVQIVDHSIAYLRAVLGVDGFTPLSFRAGNWVFQPTKTAANVLAERGIKVDSSVFKGGRRHQYKLDYRRALRNGYYWMFTDHADIPDPQGALLELPIYTQMIPFYKMAKPKRVNFQHIGFGTTQSSMNKLYRSLDFLRFWHPLKFDFGCMTINEIKSMIDLVIQEDQENPLLFRPIVAIGHTKELVDFEVIESLLSYLENKGITVSTFSEVYHKCTC